MASKMMSSWVPASLLVLASIACCQTEGLAAVRHSLSSHGQRGSQATTATSSTNGASAFKLTYYFQTIGDVFTVSSGGSITFPEINVNGSAVAVITVGNVGSGSDNIDSITLTGENFQLLGVELLPALINPGQALQFNVAYTPTMLATSTGMLTVVYDSGTISVGLSGTPSGPLYSYTTVAGNSLEPFTPGQTVILPDTTLGQTSTLTVQVTNSGNAKGAVTGIAVSGQGFFVSNLPIMPVVIAPNGSVQFSLSFTPSEPGVSNGYLQIGTDTFKLTSTGNGAELTYSYIQAGGSTSIHASQTLIWGSVQIGQASQIQFTVNNQGNIPATVSSIAITTAKSAYTVANLPTMPATIAANGELSFSLLFSPTALGDNIAQLQVGAASFNLGGVGTPPPALPAISLSGPAETAGPMQQPALSLTLALPYPIALSGTLTLNVSSSDFVVDPAVQFSTGGLTASFTIPANTTQAQFPTGSSIQLQTGTVAGTITVSATLATSTGVDVTPSSPPTITFRIPPSPPRVLDIELGSQASTGLTIVVTGYSTNRSLTELKVNFVPSSSYSVPVSSFTFNIETIAADWYNTSESQRYGSLFTASIPFTSSSNLSNLGQVLQSISATLSNALGQSNFASFTFQP